MVWEVRRSGWRKHADDARSDADIDYGRIVHSASFRRLQGKTQILNLGDSDFYRTRLTHSLEVAQIAGSVTRQLRRDNDGHEATKHLPDLALIQAIGSTHDLGHPPFGHGGEVALNYCMSGRGGFEGNGQTLRILARLEKFSDEHGADLTRRTLLGTLKYPVPFSRAFNQAKTPRLVSSPTVLRLIDRKQSKPPKCYMDSEQAAVDWILDPLTPADRDAFVAAEETAGKHATPLHKSLDCSIMDLSDDIAFGIHDLEDALGLGLVSRDQFERGLPRGRCAAYLDWLGDRYPSEADGDGYDAFVRMLFGGASERKHAISRLVHYMVLHCTLETRKEFVAPLLRFRAGMKPGARGFLDALKDFVYEMVIRSPSVQQLEFKGQRMVVSVFEALMSEPEAFLPRSTYALYAKTGDERVICDHVAGMTDMFLLRTYERLFSPRMGSVFDNV